MLRRFLPFPLVVSCALMAQSSYPPGGQGPVGPNQPNPSAKRYTVSGTVSNAQTGAPVPRAVVRAFGVEPSQAFTDDSGHFELKDVLEGRLTLGAQRPGYQMGHGFQQQVVVGASTPSVQLKLMPQSSMRGHIVNSDGEPIEGLQVQALRQQVIGGMREWMPSNVAGTDETGNFVMEDLTPGSYLLRTLAHRVFAAGIGVVVDGRHFPDLYPAQYYPNAPDRTSAQVLQVQAGAEAQVDITLSAVPSFTASGTSSNERSMILTCDTAEGETVSNAFRRGRDGQFTMLLLPPGPCTIHARTSIRGAEAAYAELPINVGSADLTGLQLNLEPLRDVPVVFSGNETTAGSPATAGTNLQLVPRQMGSLRQFPQMTNTGDVHAFSGVSPGAYRVVPQPYGGACLASITSGSVDLMRSDLTVAAGGSVAPIEVRLRKDCGSIVAKVDGAAEAAAVSVVLVPEGAPNLAKLVFAGNGSAQIRDITPGEYMIYAAPNLSDFAYAEPDVLKGIEGQKVSVGPNAQLNVQLQLGKVRGEER